MRTLSLAYYFHFKGTDEATKYKMIKEVSAVTHAHPLAVISCYIYIDFALEALQGALIENSYQKILADKSKYYGYLNQAEQVYFHNIFEKDLKNFSEPEIKSSGFVIDSLEASFWCLLNSTNYRDTVLKAVNLGLDTDTIAAIAGGIAGIAYGYDAIPAVWVSTIAKGSDIDAVCESLAKSFQ